jgi:intergrase/recombinase
MGYCRKIFATFMRQMAGVESEIIDVLQGRSPSTVFAKHYLRPSGLDFRGKVLAGLEELERERERERERDMI